MAEKKKVILARPHPFIASEMQEFLRANGFEPMPIESIKELDTLDAEEVAGAVISTSVVSSVTESPHDVLVGLRAHVKGVPVVFASLVEFGLIKDSILKALSGVVDDPKLEPLDEKSYSDPSLGSEKTFVVIHKDDLADEKKRFIADKVIGKHFG